MPEIILINTDLIDVNPSNAMYSNATADDLMVASIREQGILAPLTVIPSGSRWLLESGHRRLDGARQANLKAVPCIVAEPKDDADAAIRHVFHNLQRAKTEGDIYAELSVLSKTLSDRPDLAETYGLSQSKSGENGDFGGQPPKSKKRVMFEQLAAAWHLTRNRVEMLWNVFDDGLRDEWITTLPTDKKKKLQEVIAEAISAWDGMRDSVNAGDMSLKAAYTDLAELKRYAADRLANKKTKAAPKPEPSPKPVPEEKVRSRFADDSDLGWMLPILDGSKVRDESPCAGAVVDAATGQTLIPCVGYIGGREYLVLVVHGEDDERRYAVDWDMLEKFQPV